MKKKNKKKKNTCVQTSQVIGSCINFLLNEVASQVLKVKFMACQLLFGYYMPSSVGFFVLLNYMVSYNYSYLIICLHTVK